MSYFERPRPEMLPLVPADARRVLDVGCGAGAFARTLKERPGLEVWGVEAVAEVAAQAHGLDRVLVGPIESVIDQLPDRHFDWIVCNDVLEHLVDPEACLRRLVPKVAPGGGFVASIPNLRYYKVLRQLVLHGEFEYQNDGVLDRTHLRFFTPKSMARLWERLGCRVVERHLIQPRRRAWLRALSMLTGGRTEDMRAAQVAWRVLAPGS